MTVFVFFGKDTIAMDKYYLDFRQQYEQVAYFDLAQIREIEERLDNQGFFPVKSLAVFKNVFLKQVKVGKVSGALDLLLKKISQAQLGDTLFIDEDVKKVKYYRQYFPQATFKEFKISPYLFNFLDALFPGNLTVCFNYWQKSLSKDPVELTVFMLKRRVRELICLSSGNLRGNYQPWQLGKLKQQLKAWDTKKLISVYRALFNYEKGLKSGLNPLSSKQAIETILALYL